jgi:hypothetical protein
VAGVCLRAYLVHSTYGIRRRRRPWRECAYVRTWYILHTEEAVAGVCLRAYLVHSTYVFFVTRATKDGKIVNSAVGTYEFNTIAGGYIFFS